MDERGIWKNVTGTAFALGLAISPMNFNNTQIACLSREISPAIYSYPDEKPYNAAFNFSQTDISNIYSIKKRNLLEETAEELFGPMREATIQESESVNNYVRSISKNTGVSFFDLC